MLIDDIPNLTDQERSNAECFSNGYLREATALAAADLRRIVALRDLDHNTSLLLCAIEQALRAAPSGAEKAASDFILHQRRQLSSVQASEREHFNGPLPI